MALLQKRAQQIGFDLNKDMAMKIRRMTFERGLDEIERLEKIGFGGFDKMIKRFGDKKAGPIESS